MAPACGPRAATGVTLKDEGWPYDWVGSMVVMDPEWGWSHNKDGPTVGMAQQ